MHQGTRPGLEIHDEVTGILSINRGQIDHYKQILDSLVKEACVALDVELKVLYGIASQNYDEIVAVDDLKAAKLTIISNKVNNALRILAERTPEPLSAAPSEAGDSVADRDRPSRGTGAMIYKLSN